MNQQISKSNEAFLTYKVLLPVVVGLAILLFMQPPAQAVEATEGEGPHPAVRYVTKVSGGVANANYLKRKADQLLDRWRLYEETPEGERLKKELYDVSIKGKDELISRIHYMCSESADPENVYCLMYADTVRKLSVIPDLVPGKWYSNSNR